MNEIQKNALIGKVVSLDTGQQAPTKVKIINISSTIVECLYMNSMPGRIEKISIRDFEFFSEMKLLWYNIITKIKYKDFKNEI